MGNCGDGSSLSLGYPSWNLSVLEKLRNLESDGQKGAALLYARQLTFALYAVTLAGTWKQKGKSTEHFSVVVVLV